jgi:mannose-6-phosphate isomerase-like protein (cupin superfamily)
MNPLPGAVGVSHLAVYDDSGSPHVHLTCTEAYVIQSGEGAVQTLGPGGFEEVPLRPMDVVWFTPGLVHRLINGDALQLLVLMQNGGLPEAGDAVFTFPAEVMSDPDEYARCAALPADRERRELAVEGFAALRGAGPGALDDFYAAAVRIVAPRLDEWEARWRAGALAAAERTGEQLAALKAGDPGGLREARLHRGYTNEEPRRLGMCGRLATLETVA